MARAGGKTFRAALPPGYSLRGGAKHLFVIAPDGDIARDQNGRPITIPKGAKTKKSSVPALLRRLGQQL